ISASASDNVAVTGVRFLVDDNPVGAELTAAPFQQTMSTDGLSNGNHVLTAIAHDAAGNQQSSVANVIVGNDTDAPTVALTSPADGGLLAGGVTVAGVVAVLATATDDGGVAGVQFKIDGVAAGTEVTAAPYALVWNVADVANGSHTVSAIARDAAGHATTASVTVTVANDNAAP